EDGYGQFTYCRAAQGALDAVRVQLARVRDQFRPVADERSALTGRDALAPVETERGHVAEAARRPAPVRRPGRTRRVLDNEQPVPVGDRPQLVVVRALPERVDRHDPDRLRGER